MSSRSGPPIRRFVTPSIYKSTRQTSVNADEHSRKRMEDPVSRHRVRTHDGTARPDHAGPLAETLREMRGTVLATDEHGRKGFSAAYR
jgi:hypothetical protein